jgi:hypothetical protein
MLQGHRLLLLQWFAVVLLVSGCGVAEEPQSSMLLVCNSRWFGEIPATSEVAIQACIKEGLCSEVLGDGRYEPGNAPEERDEADAAECLQYPSSCGGALSGEIAMWTGGIRRMEVQPSHWTLL